MLRIKPTVSLALMIGGLTLILGFLGSTTNRSVWAAIAATQVHMTNQEESTLTASATPIPEVTLTPSPTVRVKATPTPLVIPPPTNPGTRRLMVGFGVLIVLVVIVGIWINRERAFK